ncbi:DoxX family protein [Dyadobacter tibetensis]|uniref:DoxX family protein n=1 Tax=Dyadobacter tibetensis TaxID=1211851 RepID=UPI000472341A|nr:DoxX family protein [Dyadobacter tibetensis]
MGEKNKIIYWAATSLLALGMLSGGISQLMGVEETIRGITHLGYPAYFPKILGAWKIFGVIILLIPRFQLIKEWAYAGFFFAMTGAIVSHVASSDEVLQYIAPIIFTLLILISWYFRPVSRKLPAILNQN